MQPLPSAAFDVSQRDHAWPEALRCDATSRSDVTHGLPDEKRGAVGLPDNVGRERRQPPMQPIHSSFLRYALVLQLLTNTS